jgi:6,7-dimethyl-8-ribityllumazine synthase
MSPADGRGPVDDEAALSLLAGDSLRIAVACSRFNRHVTDLLLQGALSRLQTLGVGDDGIEVVWVPGAFELPLVARALAATGRVDAVICLGAVIRGETGHYDFVAGECASGLQRVQLDTGVPAVFGVLTTENLEQALERAGGRHGNKGEESADAAVEMAGLLRRIAKSAGTQL